MAEKTISVSIAQGKTNFPEILDSVGVIQDEGAFFVSSKDIALHFQKKHTHILRDIQKILSITPKSFTEPNFRPSEYLDPTGRTLPCFRLTRDAFSLLAMGFTGAAAIRWKLKYIEAFNALEAGLLENARQEALAEGRRQALPEALRLSKRLTPQRLAEIKKALAYEARGFYHVEIAKMLDCSHDKARQLLRDARALGMIAPAKKEARP